MAAYRIPDRYLAGLASLATLSPALVGQLCVVLSDDPTNSARRLTGTLKTLGIEPSEATKAAEALLSIFSLKYAEDLTAEALAADLVAALSEQSAETPPESAEEVLRNLLSVEAQTKAVKVPLLAAGDERTYCGSRIVTDLRPVFGDDPSVEPQGFVMIHLLEILFHARSRERESFHVALSTADLEEFGRQVERAQTKAKALEVKLAAIGSRLYGSTES